jgi:hypothetical protein
MANVVYNSFKKNLLNANVNFSTGTITAMLVTSSYSPDQDTHAVYSDVTNEVTGTGYTAGGKALTNGTVTQNNSTDRGVYDADDVTWGTSSITARAAVLYRNTGVGSTSPLIGYFDFTTDQTSASGNFTIQWSANGIVNIT